MGQYKKAFRVHFCQKSLLTTPSWIGRRDKKQKTTSAFLATWMKGKLEYDLRK